MGLKHHIFFKALECVFESALSCLRLLLHFLCPVVKFFSLSLFPGSECQREVANKGDSLAFELAIPFARNELSKSH